ncbi:MAG TPA: hypothetical protein PKH92_14215 [Anaerolineaceae bacterium]|nr:hypothetical protein [Anaerolineaceae bacterium]
MKFSFRQIVLLTGIGMLLCSTLGCAINRPKDGGDEIMDPQGVIEKVNNVLPTGYIPEHFTQEVGSYAPQPGDFDPMAFFEALDALTIKEGYRLDYVYYFDGFGGFPVLYVRPEEQVPFSSVEELDASPDAALMRDYMSYIQPDDTADGYYQYVVFSIMVQQFYLFWHSNYNDVQIVCTPEKIRQIIDATGEFGIEMPADDKAKSLLINPTPTVAFSEERVVVRIVTFTNWGGFFEKNYKISRTNPTTMYTAKNENLVPYQCGVMY